MDTPPSNPPASEAELLQAGYRFALPLTHHREEAEDLVQETWLNLCRRYGQVENRAVLFSALRNLFIDQCRRKKVVYFESLDQSEILDVPETLPEEPGVKGELSELLGKLKPQEREMIFLHYYEGHTAEEIARMNDMSRGTVLSLLHRTVAKLRKSAAFSAVSTLRNQIRLLLVLLMSADG